MENINFKSEQVGDRVVIGFVGALQGSFFQDVKEDIHSKLVPGVKRLVLDLTEVDYLSSSGIGFLVSMLNRCRPMGIDVVMAGLHDDSADIFRLTRLDQVFEIFPSREEALAVE